MIYHYQPITEQLWYRRSPCTYSTHSTLVSFFFFSSKVVSLIFVYLLYVSTPWRCIQDMHIYKFTRQFENFFGKKALLVSGVTVISIVALTIKT